MFSGHEVSFWLLLVSIKQLYDKKETGILEKCSEISDKKEKSKYTKSQSRDNSDVTHFYNLKSIERSFSGTKKCKKTALKVKNKSQNKQEFINGKNLKSENYFDKMQVKYLNQHVSKTQNEGVEISGFLDDYLKRNGMRSSETDHSKKRSFSESSNKIKNNESFEKTKSNFLKSLFLNTEMKKPLKRKLNLKPEKAEKKKQIKTLETKKTKNPLGKIVQPETMDLNFFKIQTFAKPVREFLETLDLSYLLDSFFVVPLLEDPFRNGICLCLIVHRSFNLTVKSVCRNPLTVPHCIRNFKNAIQALLRFFQNTEISIFDSKIDQVMMGCYNIIFEFILFLQKLALGGTGLGNNNDDSGVLLGFKSINKSFSKAQKNRKSSEKLAVKMPVRNIKKVGTEFENNNELTLNPVLSNVIKWLFSRGIIKSLRETPEKICKAFLTENLLYKSILHAFSDNQLRSLKKPPFLMISKKVHIFDALDECLHFLRKVEDFPRVHIESKRKLYNSENSAVFGILNDIIEVASKNGKEIGKSIVKKSVLDKTDAFKFWGSQTKMFMENNELFYHNRILNSHDFVDKTTNSENFRIENNCKQIIFDQKFEKSKNICLEFLKNVNFCENMDFNPPIITVPEFQNGILLKKLFDLLLNESIDGLQFPPKNTAACKNNIRKLLATLLKSNYTNFRVETKLEALVQGNVHSYAEIFEILGKLFYIRIQQINKRKNI